MLPAAFLAQATSAAATHSDKLDPSNPTVFLGLLMGALLTLAAGANQIDSIIQRRKRTPSVDVDLVGLSAAITTLTTTVDELKADGKSHNGNKDRIAALEAKCAELKSQLESEIRTQRSYIAKTHKDISDQIEGVRSSFANNLQSVERGLGRVEGALQTLVAAKSS